MSSPKPEEAVNRYLTVVLRIAENAEGKLVFDQIDNLKGAQLSAASWSHLMDECDALKAKLEAAERELAGWTHYMGSECTPKSLSEAADEDQRTMHRLLIGKEKAESRAEALAEALRKIANGADMFTEYDLAVIARAALEGK